MKIKGFFITLEGIDGCGKTTQARLLAEHLAGKGMSVVRSREPGGTGIGLKIRSILLDPGHNGMNPVTEMLLYSADRAQHISEVIEPALASGKVVICDRFADATTAYQGYARGIDLDLVGTLEEIATRGCSPDLTVLLDIPVEEALGRAIGRNNTHGTGHEGRFEEESAAFHEKVRQGYLAIAQCEPERVKIIDATGSVEEIQARIRAAVDKVIGRRDNVI